MTQLIEFIRNNPDIFALIVALQAVLIPLSGILRAAGFVNAARVVGVFSQVDLNAIFSFFSKRKQAATVAAKSTVALLVLMALPGCQAFAKVVDSTQDVCETKLAELPDVIREAQIREIPVGVLVDGFCKLTDVAAIFTEKKPASGGPRLAAQKPEAQALALLRAKGEIE